MPAATSGSAMNDKDDKDLFREAVAGARPLVHDRHAPTRPRANPQAAFRRADERAVLEESLQHQAADLDVETGDEILFRRATVGSRVLRDLRRGRFAIEDELDLHGLVADEARVVVRDFLAGCVARRLSCVRIVHGKGRGSGPRGPVLKKSVNLWLRKNESVLAFCSARTAHGGTGAIYVLLAR
jgi:DNA-nicking Smr family endonuclease